MEVKSTSEEERDLASINTPPPDNFKILEERLKLAARPDLVVTKAEEDPSLKAFRENEAEIARLEDVTRLGSSGGGPFWARNIKRKDVEAAPAALAAAKERRSELLAKAHDEAVAENVGRTDGEEPQDPNAYSPEALEAVEKKIADLKKGDVLRLNAFGSRPFGMEKVSAEEVIRAQGEYRAALIRHAELLAAKKALEGAAHAGNTDASMTTLGTSEYLRTPDKVPHTQEAAEKELEEARKHFAAAAAHEKVLQKAANRGIGGYMRKRFGTSKNKKPEGDIYLEAEKQYLLARDRVGVFHLGKGSQAEAMAWQEFIGNEYNKQQEAVVGMMPQKQAGMVGRAFAWYGADKTATGKAKRIAITTSIATAAFVGATVATGGTAAFALIAKYAASKGVRAVVGVTASTAAAETYGKGAAARSEHKLKEELKTHLIGFRPDQAGEIAERTIRSIEAKKLRDKHIGWTKAIIATVAGGGAGVGLAYLDSLEAISGGVVPHEETHAPQLDQAQNQINTTPEAVPVESLPQNTGSEAVAPQPEPVPTAHGDGPQMSRVPRNFNPEEALKSSHENSSQEPGASSEVEKPVSTGGAETAVPNPGTPTETHLFDKDITVGHGDNVWKIIEHHLNEAKSGYGPKGDLPFSGPNGLSRAERDYIIDGFVKHIQHSDHDALQKMGFTTNNLNVIALGQTLHLQELDKSSWSEKILHRAYNLTNAEKQNIMRYRLEHPHSVAPHQVEHIKVGAPAQQVPTPPEHIHVQAPDGGTHSTPEIIHVPSDVVGAHTPGLSPEALSQQYEVIHVPDTNTNPVDLSAYNKWEEAQFKTVDPVIREKWHRLAELPLKKAFILKGDTQVLQEYGISTEKDLRAWQETMSGEAKRLSVDSGKKVSDLIAKIITNPKPKQ